MLATISSVPVLDALPPRDGSLAALLERVAEQALVADSSGRIVYAHPAAERALRQPVEALAGQSGAALRQWLGPEWSGGAAAPGAVPFARALQGEAAEAEYHFATGAAQPGWIRWSEAPLRDAAGLVRGAVAWAQEVPAPRRHVAGAAPRPTAVADAHAGCREMLATISHDLKNPLTRIKGLAQVLQRRLARDRSLDPAQIHDALAQIDRTVGKMTIALNELVETAHVPAGEAPALECRWTDLVAVVRHLVEEYQQATEHHRISLHTEEPELVGTWDAPRLERAVSNLISNAVKYSPGGGEIVVRLERAEPEGWAVLQVRDEGIGIPTADLPRIFEGTHRAANAVGRIAGTGMGLPAVRQTVEQHGGIVVADSQEGRGTTVTVWLPLHPAPVVSEASRRP